MQVAKYMVAAYTGMLIVMLRVCSYSWKHVLSCIALYGLASMITLGVTYAWTKGKEK